MATKKKTSHTSKASRRKRASTKKGAAKQKATINLQARAAAKTVEVTFESEPKTGMTIKIDSVTLKTNPRTLQLTPGEHLLEWTFVGPSGAKFKITVTGAREPSNSIDEQIAPGRVLAAGSYDVLV